MTQIFLYRPTVNKMEDLEYAEAFFKEFPFDIEQLKLDHECLDYDCIMTDITSSTPEDRLILMDKQLQIRDEVMFILKYYILELVAAGCKLEEVVKELRSKITAMEEKIGGSSMCEQEEKNLNKREESTVEPMEKPVEPIGKSAEEPIEESVKEHTKETTDKFTVATVVKPVKKITEEPTEEAMEEFIEEPTNEPAEQAMEEYIEESTKQTIEEPPDDRWLTAEGIAAAARDVASNIVATSGYVYHKSLGLYYDHVSGYYYDAEKSLYYDTQTNTYFYYDHDSQSYKFHSYGDVKDDQQDLSTKVGEHNAVTNSAGSEQNENACSSDESIIQDVAPSLRIMVTTSEQKGQLHLVTIDGGSIGRENTNIVHLEHESISKVHANIEYRSSGTGDHHYFVRDSGSENGTYVQGKRLSESKEESEYKELGHNWILRCGLVFLTCHLHPRQLTCNECEPGLVAETKEKKVEKIISNPTERTEQARRQEVKKLRKKYDLTYHKELNRKIDLEKDGKYTDRATVRRKVVGSDNPYEKTEVASAEVSISTKNKGFKMLQKMGWSEGQGLGSSQKGLAEPIAVNSSVGRTGLGAKPAFNASIPQSNKSKMLLITQSRYNALHPQDGKGDGSKALKSKSNYQPIKFQSAGIVCNETSTENKLGELTLSSCKVSVTTDTKASATTDTKAIEPQMRLGAEEELKIKDFLENLCEKSDSDVEVVCLASSPESDREMDTVDGRSSDQPCLSTYNNRRLKSKSSSPLEISEDIHSTSNKNRDAISGSRVECGAKEDISGESNILTAFLASVYDAGNNANQVIKTPLKQKIMQNKNAIMQNKNRDAISGSRADCEAKEDTSGESNILTAFLASVNDVGNKTNQVIKKPLEQKIMQNKKLDVWFNCDEEIDNEIIDSNTAEAICDTNSTDRNSKNRHKTGYTPSFVPGRDEDVTKDMSENPRRKKTKRSPSSKPLNFDAHIAHKSTANNSQESQSLSNYRNTQCSVLPLQSRSTSVDLENVTKDMSEKPTRKTTKRTPSSKAVNLRNSQESLLLSNYRNTQSSVLPLRSKCKSVDLEYDEDYAAFSKHTQNTGNLDQLSKRPTQERSYNLTECDMEDDERKLLEYLSKSALADDADENK